VTTAASAATTAAPDPACPGAPSHGASEVSVTATTVPDPSGPANQRPRASGASALALALALDPDPAANLILVALPPDAEGFPQVANSHAGRKDHSAQWWE